MPPSLFHEVDNPLKMADNLEHTRIPRKHPPVH